MDQQVVAYERHRYKINDSDREVGYYVGDGTSNGIANRDGKGIYRYLKDDQLYIGDWRNGKMHGFGKLYWSEKKIRYEGEFKNGLFHGHGT